MMREWPQKQILVIYVGLIVALTFDILTLKSIQCILVPNCIGTVNMVKFRPVVY